jgi:hypothetical protein
VIFWSNAFAFVPNSFRLLMQGTSRRLSVCGRSFEFFALDKRIFLSGTFSFSKELTGIHMQQLQCILLLRRERLLLQPLKPSLKDYVILLY